MEDKKQNKPTFEERQNMRRNRKINTLRFTQGIKQLFFKKLKFIIFALFIAVMTFIWFNRYIFLTLSSTSFENTFKLLFDIVFWLIFSIFTSGILVLFGKPKNAQAIEDDIKDVFKIKETHKVPILASIIYDKENNIRTYKFYSPDFAKYRYEEEKINIEQKLGVKILDKVKSKGKYIIFDTISNENIKQTEVLKDDTI